MDGLHADSSLLPFLPPPVSLSAPASIRPSRIATPKSPHGPPPTRDWVSAPASPISKKKKKFMSTHSPKHHLRRHKYHAVFATATREVLSDAQCPIHSYRGQSTLTPLGAATVGKAKTQVTLPSLCPVHVYAEPASTLKRSGMGAFGKESSERNEVTSHGPAVHSYASPVTTLKRSGVGAFARSALLRNEQPAHGPAVHSYTRDSSTLKRSGVAPFGSTAARPTNLPLLSRTGLLNATLTPVPPRVLPKLVVPELNRRLGQRVASPTSVLSEIVEGQDA